MAGGIPVKVRLPVKVKGKVRMPGTRMKVSREVLEQAPECFEVLAQKPGKNGQEEGGVSRGTSDTPSDSGTPSTAENEG